MVDGVLRQTAEKSARYAGELRPVYLPILTAAKTSKLSLLVKHHFLAIDEAS